MYRCVHGLHVVYSQKGHSKRLLGGTTSIHMGQVGCAGIRTSQRSLVFFLNLPRFFLCRNAHATPHPNFSSFCSRSQARSRSRGDKATVDEGRANRRSLCCDRAKPKRIRRNKVEYSSERGFDRVERIKNVLQLRFASTDYYSITKESLVDSRHQFRRNKEEDARGQRPLAVANSERPNAKVFLWMVQNAGGLLYVDAFRIGTKVKLAMVVPLVHVVASLALPFPKKKG